MKTIEITLKTIEEQLESLKAYLEAKETEVENCLNINSHISSTLSNRKKDIENLELEVQLALKNIQQPQLNIEKVAGDFKRKANNIKLEIDKISC